MSSIFDKPASVIIQVGMALTLMTVPLPFLFPIEYSYTYSFGTRTYSHPNVDLMKYPMTIICFTFGIALIAALFAKKKR
jgi:hypothetical protein